MARTFETDGASFTLEIRRAEPADAAIISRLLQESFVEFRPLYTPEGFAATTPDADQVMARMREGPVWLALRDAGAAGTVAAVLKSESVYIRGMAVLPSTRALGVGARLLAQVEDWSREQGCSRMVLSTTPFLHAAIRMYEKSGFRRTGDADLFGTPLFTMEKRILL
jgi:putative acetyltransferase